MEEDWEKDDPSPPTTSRTNNKTLRPSAPTFQPRPSSTQSLPHSTSTSPTDPFPSLSSSIAGPSRPHQSSSSRQPLKPPTHPVSASNNSRAPEEDDWFRTPAPSSNKKIWESANSSSSTPSIISPISSNSGINDILPPHAQPSIKILRRDPNGGNVPKRGNGTQTPPKTMEEREEEYRLARERIFGNTPNPPAGASSSGAGAGLGSGGGLTYREGVGGYTGSGGVGLDKERSGSGGGRSRIGGSSNLGPVPSQTQRRSPGPGIVRQPIGPGQGGGFGR